MSIFNKVIQATEAALDSYIEKAKTNKIEDQPQERKAEVEINFAENEQYGYKERRGLVGPDVLKSMARKDSIVIAIHQTRVGQISEFTKPQKDRYSPGYIFEPEEPADISKEDKMRLADPELQKDDEAYQKLKYELETEKNKKQIQQDKDIEKLKEFIKYCGLSSEERDTTYKRVDFDKFCKLIVRDRLTYNYSAVELIPTKDGKRISNFYPVGAGTIRYVSKKSAENYNKLMTNYFKAEGKPFDASKEYRYVQVVRGRIVAAWTEEEFVFEAANPTVDPEDNGYAVGELELLIQIVTSHLYAEAHNRNFFTQGIGTKGLLHIKGDNISRGQLEAFKRQWFSQLTNTRNAFRPPIVGMADDVKWIPLAQSNREMEFEQWMNYLIRITCAIYQIDPSEINFDISKVNTSTLNETSNEARLKSSRDKGLKPLLGYVENLINNHILPAWDKKLADKYKFKFVGLDAESKQQEIDRFQKETQTWKTVNEVRTEMGKGPIEGGDIILNAAYTQLLMQKQMAEQQAGMEDPNANPMAGDPNEELDTEGGDDLELDGILDEVLNTDELQSPDLKTQEKGEKEAQKKKEEKTKKSMTVEYHHFED